MLRSVVGWKNRLKRKDLTAQFVLGSGGSLFIRVVSSGIALVSTIILTRLLGLQEYGTYAYTISWLTALVLLGRLGFNQAATRYIASYASLKEWGKLRGFVHYCVTTVYKFSIGVALICLAILFLSGGAIQSYFEDDGIYNTFLIAMAILPLVAHLELNEGILDGFKRVVQSQLPMRVIRPALIALGLLGLFYLTSIGKEGDVITAETAMTINLCSTFIALIFSVRLRQSAIPSEVKGAAAEYHKTEWFSTSRDMMLATAFYLILVQADVMMLGILVNEEAAGLYTVASRIATLLVLALASVNAILQPIAAGLYSNQKFDELQRIVSLGATAVFAISLIGCFVLYFGADYMHLIFGDEFRETDDLLRILIIGQLVNAFAGPAVLLLNMTKHQRDAARIMAVGAVLNLILNFVFIKWLGTAGAAVATSTTTILWNIAAAYVAWARLKIVSIAFWKLSFKPKE